MPLTETATKRRTNLLIWWLVWYLWGMPRAIIKITANFLRFALNYFSFGLLIRTLFDPWRQYRWKYPRGFDFQEYGSVFFSNLISRFLGFSARIFLMLVGIISEFFLLIAGILTFFFWLFSLPLSIAFIVLGLRWMTGV